MKKLYEETWIQSIADAIRRKNKKQDRYTVSCMPDAIDSISTDDPDLVFDVKNATTTGAVLGGHIATGVNLGDYEYWTLFIDVDLSDYVWSSDFRPRIVHSMWEESPYPGFTFDLNVVNQSRYKPRIAIGSSAVYTLKNNVNLYDHAVYVITCSNGTVTVYDDAHTEGYVLNTKYNTTGYKAYLTIGGKAETTGEYTRLIALQRIDVRVYKRVLSLPEINGFLELVHLKNE